MSLTQWALVALALLVLLPLSRLVIAFVFGPSIGARAMANQPDSLTLVPSLTGAWSQHEPWLEPIAGLERLGFEPGGTFDVQDYKGAVLRLYALPREDWYATLHAHPVAGSWLTFTTYFADGTRCHFTTAKPTGLVPPSGHVVVHAPGTGAAALFERARRERPDRQRLPVNPRDAAQAYARAFAEDMAWRKAHGISRSEVVSVAMRRVA